MLVILKIPVVYLCAVVWWAIRAEPRPLEGAGRLRSLAPRPRAATGDAPDVAAVRAAARPAARRARPARRVAYARARAGA